MNVPHDFLIQLVRKDKIVDRICEVLGISVYSEESIIERINTLQTVYELHQENYKEKVPAVHEGESTELISSQGIA